MAEFLIKAQGNLWMENLAKEDWATKKLTQEQFDARSEIGDIVVVKPDGHPWGRCECPPQYVVIKVPKMDWEKAKILEKGLYETRLVTVGDREEEQQIMRKKHLYQVPSTLVDLAVKEKGVLEIKEEEMIAYISKRSLDANKVIVKSAITAMEING
jgi:hypothetical protein